MELSATAPAQELAPHGQFVICYRCSYQSDETGSSCPKCSFPLITRNDASPAGGIRLADVLNRDSVRVGAPPLPGVDATPRKAQLLTEYRKQKRARVLPPSGDIASEPPTAARAGATTAGATTAGSATAGSRWGVAIVCLSAVVLGIVAAAVQNAI